MVALLMLPSLTLAQSSLHLTFEDGGIHGAGTSMRVRPQNLSDGQNRFLRITGSPGDCDAIPPDLCPPRNRSTVRFTSPHGSMPVITSQNMRQTYRADIRFHDDRGIDGSALSLYQDAPGGESYGARNGTGPVVRIWRENGMSIFNANYANETHKQDFPVRVRSGAWHTYEVLAVWSHDPRVGRIEFRLDGQTVGVVSGRDVNLGPASNRLPEVKLGLYGDHATGIVDVDNVFVGPSDGSSMPDEPPPETQEPPTPPPPLPPLPPPIVFEPGPPAPGVPRPTQPPVASLHP